MKIPFLPSFLLTFVFQYPVLSLAGEAQEQLISTWTIPIPQPVLDHLTTTKYALESREIALWLNPEPNPPSNEVFTLGQTVDVEWTTDFDWYYVFLWQQELDHQFATADEQPIYTKSEDDKEEGGFTWIATTGDFLLSDSNVFFFSLGQNDSLTGVFTDHYFNLTDADTSLSTSSSKISSTSIASRTSSTVSTSSRASSTTSSATSTTMTVATSTPPSSTTQGAAVPAAQTSNISTSRDSTNSSTSSGTKLGLGLGLGLGIPLIALLAALVYLKYRQIHGKNIKDANPEAISSPRETDSMMQSGGLSNEAQGALPTSFYNKNWRGAELPEENGINELPDSSRINELPA